MDTLKKIIHPHKTSHHEDDSTTTTNTNQNSKLKTSDTGENIANPFMEQNTVAAEQFRQTHTSPNTTTEPSSHPVQQHNAHTTPPSESHGQQQHGGLGASRHAPSTGEASHLPSGGHHQQPNAPTGLTAAASSGASATDYGSSARGDEHVPGVNTGGAQVVEARMPVEEGNNFPGTNPNPGHEALGTREEGGLKFAGGE